MDTHLSPNFGSYWIHDKLWPTPWPLRVGSPYRGAWSKPTRRGNGELWLVRLYCIAFRGEAASGAKRLPLRAIATALGLCMQEDFVV